MSAIEPVSRAPRAAPAQGRAGGGGVARGAALPPALARAVEASIVALPSRFQPEHAAPGRRRYRLRVAGSAPMTVVTAGGRCQVWPTAAGAVRAELATDARSWLALAAGETTGLELFLAGRLQILGDLNEALRLGTLFAPPPDTIGAAGSSRMVRYRAGRVDVEAFEAGPVGAPPAVLLHGLGASKVSLLPTIAGLAATHRVLALDFPGFGGSSAPVGAPYGAPWLARVVRRTMDAAGIDRAVLVGNSMGGRVAVELALEAPQRVAGLGLLCPAVAFDEYRRIRPVLRGLRLDMPVGVAPWMVGGIGTSVGRSLVDHGLRLLFAVPGRVPDANLAAAREDFVRAMGDRRHRLALLAAARQLGLEDPARFWPRLEQLDVPSLWVFGDTDRLVSPAYARLVRERLPTAQVEVWRSCGHVPQFEHPQRTTDRLLDFFAGCRVA